MSEWSKTPPVEVGYYWTRYTSGGTERRLPVPAECCESVGNPRRTRWWYLGEWWSGSELANSGLEFGQRIPTNAELFAAAGVDSELPPEGDLLPLPDLLDWVAKRIEARCDKTTAAMAPAMKARAAQLRSQTQTEGGT